MVAKANKDLLQAKDATEYINRGKDALQFQMIAIQAQLKLLEDLETLSDDEKLDTVFQLLDKNSRASNMLFNAHVEANDSGSVTTTSHMHHNQHGSNKGMIRVEHLTHGFRKVTGQDAFAAKMDSAMEKVSNFETEGNGLLTFDSFQKYIQIIAETIGCTTYEVLEMIVMNVLFSPSLMLASVKDVQCHDVLQDIVDDINTELTTDKVAVRQKLDDHVKFQRMQALFDIFDYAHDGKIHFKEVVLGMYKLTRGDVQGTANAAMTALMTCGGTDDVRSMDFEQFTRFIENVLATSPSLTLDQLADMVTIDVAKKDSDLMTPDQISELFAMDTCLKEVLYITEDAEDWQIEAACDEDICFGKASRLFELWDLDHDGFINFHDLALGLRKLEETTKMTKTMEEAEKIMKHFNVSNDNKLSDKEFFYFLTQLAAKTEYGLSEMIDNMIVAFALRENSANDVKCADAFAYAMDGSNRSVDVQTYG